MPFLLFYSAFSLPSEELALENAPLSQAQVSRLEKNALRSMRAYLTA